MTDDQNKSLTDRLVEYGGKKRYREFLTTLPSIKLLGFSERPRRPSEIAQRFEFDSNASDAAVLDWMVTLLKDLEFQGEYLLRYNEPGTSDFLQYARVDLGTSYDWVEPIFFRQGYFLLLIAPDGSRQLEIYLHEPRFIAELYLPID